MTSLLLALRLPPHHPGLPCIRDASLQLQDKPLQGSVSYIQEVIDTCCPVDLCYGSHALEVQCFLTGEWRMEQLRL